MLTCYDVANYFLAKYGDHSKNGDLISNLKIQKLVYYAQGFHLAFFDEPLFQANIEAWEHGPVVRELYNCYKSYQNNALSIPHNFDETIFTGHSANLLDQVYCSYGQFTAWKLRDMTHEETPWQISYEKGKNTIIKTDLLKSFFQTQKHKLTGCNSAFNYDLDRMKERINDEFELVPNLSTAKDIEQWLMQ